MQPQKLQVKVTLKPTMKKGKRKSELRQLQITLRERSFENYQKIMHALFLQYDEYEFCRTLSGYFRSKRFDLALKLADSLSSQSYGDATQHFVANQFSLLIRKYAWPKGSVSLDPEGAALRKFLRSERKCSLINRRFQIIDEGRSAYETTIVQLRQWIRYVIGDAPDMSKVVQNMGFSAGASLGVHGESTHVAKKLSRKKWTCTPGALTYAYWGLMNEPRLQEIICEAHGQFYDTDVERAKARYYSKMQLVTNNNIGFVPKTAKTHRVIAVEPLLNGFVQKGVDLVLRNKLKRLGIDLQDQSINQRLAREGSFVDDDDSFVTIDLASASDSISIGLARSLLPPDWFDLLNSIRSPEYKLNGKKFKYHKFCSMGNGFCFPLETLLFAACCATQGCGTPAVDFAVYGDDIVIRKRFAPSVLRVLKLMGFEANKEKTCLSGPFRESCGADWFGGVDVRPYTLDEALDSVQNIFKCLNLTRRSPRCEAFFEGVRPLILGLLPGKFQYYRPFDGPEDTGINPIGNEFMSAEPVSFSRKTMRWSWNELQTRPIEDDEPHLTEDRRNTIDMYALLAGFKPGTSRNEKRETVQTYLPAYTLRRKTRTTVVRQSYRSTSQWIPGGTIRLRQERDFLLPVSPRHGVRCFRIEFGYC